MFSCLVRRPVPKFTVVNEAADNDTRHQNNHYPLQDAGKGAT